MTNAEFIADLQNRIVIAGAAEDKETVKVCSNALRIALRGGPAARRFRRDYERRIQKLPASKRSSNP